MRLEPGFDVAIDAAAAVAPYEQIRSQIAAAIAAGSLAVGTRLPTVRALAEQLGLAPNTVARSYRELELAGLVETAGRAGTVVSAAGSVAHQRVVDAAREYVALVAAVGLDRRDAARIVTAALDIES